MVKQKGVITVIDEPTYVVDMEKLLARYAKKLLGNEKQRFRCDNDKCGRFLWSKNTSSFKCSSCGHGTMRPAPPKVYCCECGIPIYFNVNSNLEVVCDKCTAKKVEEVAELERKFGRQIQARRKKARKGKQVDRKKEPLGIIRNEKDYRYASKLRDKKEDLEQAKSSHKELVEARKKSGWSQKTLANYLGCSVNYLYQMEKGRKPLNPKAQEFVREGLKFPKKKRRT
jgi:ribosome-binding protein aMBF1 (putative translation factor)